MYLKKHWTTKPTPRMKVNLEPACTGPKYLKKHSTTKQTPKYIICNLLGSLKGFYMFLTKKNYKSSPNWVAFNSLYMFKYFGMVTMKQKGGELYLTHVEKNTTALL